MKTLLIGIGNSGRQDDGLGWAFLDDIENKNSKSFDLEYRYQLQVEDAELISHYEKVIFIDASMVSYKNGFQYHQLKPFSEHSYSSHELTPETILDLTQTVYQKFPECHTLGISGASYLLEIGLTPTGKENLKKALVFFDNELFTIEKCQ